MFSFRYRLTLQLELDLAGAYACSRPLITPQANYLSIKLLNNLVFKKNNELYFRKFFSNSSSTCLFFEERLRVRSKNLHYGRGTFLWRCLSRLETVFAAGYTNRQCYRLWCCGG